MKRVEIFLFFTWGRCKLQVIHVDGVSNRASVSEDVSVSAERYSEVHVIDGRRAKPNCVKADLEPLIAFRRMFPDCEMRLNIEGGGNGSSGSPSWWCQLEGREGEKRGLLSFRIVMPHCAVENVEWSTIEGQPSE